MKKIALLITMIVLVISVSPIKTEATDYLQPQPYYKGEVLVYPIGSYDDSIIFDPEDFASYDDYLSYAQSVGIDINETARRAQTVVSYEDVSPTVLCRADLASDRDHAIQSFCKTSSTELYISQRYNNLSFNGTPYPDGNYVLISRCKIKNKVFTILDSMLLVGVGHGQTLEKMSYNGKTYFLISCGGTTREAKGNTSLDYWSTEIGRVQYSAGSVVNNSEIDRLTDLEYNTDDPSDQIKRADAAVYGNSYLLIWTRTMNNIDHFSIYNLNTINQCLSNALNHTVSFAGTNNTLLSNAKLASFEEPEEMTKSVQGLDISNKSKDIFSVYISSGNEGSSTPRPLEIHHYKSDNTHIKGVHVTNAGLWVKYGESKTFSTKAEIEGMKLESSNLQFVLRDTNKPSRQLLCTIAKSKLGS